MTDTGIPTPPHLTPAGRAEELIPAILAVLVVLCLGGIVALVVLIWPFDFGEVTWRERAGEIYLTTVPPLALLLSIILVAGVYAGQHRAVRVAGGVFFVLAALTTVMLPFFMLDFLAIRHLQSQEGVDSFIRNGVRLGGTGGLLVPFMVWVGRKAWFAGRPQPGGELVEGHGLVVGQGG